MMGEMGRMGEQGGRDGSQLELCPAVTPTKVGVQSAMLA